jgi:hypothetical protein
VGVAAAVTIITGLVALGVPAAHSILSTCSVSPTGGGVVYVDKCFSGNLGVTKGDNVNG